MTTNSRSKIPDPNDTCCNPFEDMQEAHDELRDGSQPGKLHYTSTEELMSPGPGEELEG